MKLRLVGGLLSILVALAWLSPAGCSSETPGQSGSEVTCDPGAGGDARCHDQLGDQYMCAQSGVCVLAEPEERARCGVAACDVPAPRCGAGTVPALDRDRFCYLTGEAACVPVEHCEAWPVACTPGTDGDVACSDSFGPSVACTQDGGCADARCRADSTCESFGAASDPYMCAGPNDPTVCGVPPAEECGLGRPCGDGMRCHAVADFCSVDGVGSSCAAPCTDGSCDDGFECNAEGECVAILCDNGWACPSHQLCTPEQIAADAPVYDRHHGCFNQQCFDACPDGRECVNGFCQEAIGRCEQPELVP